MYLSENLGKGEKEGRPNPHQKIFEAEERHILNHNMQLRTKTWKGTKLCMGHTESKYVTSTLCHTKGNLSLLVAPISGNLGGGTKVGQTYS